MVEARESKLLVDALKRCLKMQGMTYRDLAQSMHLSESSVKRMFASSKLSLQRYEQVCSIIGLSIFDVSKMAREEDDAQDPHTLTVEQEKHLAGDLNLLVGFHLVLNGWSFEQIAEAFAWSEPEVIKIFTTLDKIGLISLQPGNKANLLTAHNIRWLKDGPVRNRHLSLALGEFLKDKFASEDQLFDFEVVELSPASIEFLKRKMGLLLKEVNELATMDYSLKRDTKRSTGILLAMRPWVYSLALDAMTERYKSGKTQAD